LYKDTFIVLNIFHKYRLWLEQCSQRLCGWFGVAEWHYEAKWNIVDGN